MRLACSPDEETYLTVREPAACDYVVLLLTRAMCGHGEYAPTWLLQPLPQAQPQQVPQQVPPLTIPRHCLASLPRPAPCPFDICPGIRQSRSLLE